MSYVAIHYHNFSQKRSIFALRDFFSGSVARELCKLKIFADSMDLSVWFGIRMEYGLV